MWSKALGVVDDDCSTAPGRRPRHRRANYSYLALRPAAQLRHELRLPDARRGARRCLGVLANGWQVSGVYRWTSGTPYPSPSTSPGSGPPTSRAPTGSNARIVVVGRPGSRLERRPLPADRHLGLRPAAARQPRLRVGRASSSTARRSTTSISRSRSRSRWAASARVEVRLDAFNALNHTQFTGVNSQANFASLTDPRITNLPFDAGGQAGQPERFRDRRAASRSPRPAPARGAPDVLTGPTRRYRKFSIIIRSVPSPTPS